MINALVAASSDQAGLHTTSRLECRDINVSPNVRVRWMLRDQMRSVYVELRGGSRSARRHRRAPHRAHAGADARVHRPRRRRARGGRGRRGAAGRGGPQDGEGLAHGAVRQGFPRAVDLRQNSWGHSWHGGLRSIGSPCLLLGYQRLAHSRPMRPASGCDAFSDFFAAREKGEKRQTKAPSGLRKTNGPMGRGTRLRFLPAGRGRRCGPDAKSGARAPPQPNEVTMNTNPTLRTGRSGGSPLPRVRSYETLATVKSPETKGLIDLVARDRVRRPRVRRRLRAPELRRRLRRQEERRRAMGCSRGLLARRGTTSPNRSA